MCMSTCSFFVAVTFLTRVCVEKKIQVQVVYSAACVLLQPLVLQKLCVRACGGVKDHETFKRPACENSPPPSILTAAASEAGGL
jgi:hypothetical protein